MDFSTFYQVQALHQQYAHILDSNDISGWPDLFTEQCTYKLQSRENFDASHPLCILHFESQAMLRDRVYGVVNTLFHDPYSQRHICGAPLIKTLADGVISCESNYVVIRTHLDALPHVLSVGRYIDQLVMVDGLLKFSQRIAVFDNDLLPNSVIKPI